LIEQILQSQPAAYRAAMRAIARFNLEGRLAGIYQPVLVISAENDNTVPLANQLQLAKAIPHAQQVIIPEAGHAVTADHPQETNLALIQFLCEK
jgi:pimeloyl-ACP methyl ester carboxylesterase